MGEKSKWVGRDEYSCRFGPCEVIGRAHFCKSRQIVFNAVVWLHLKKDNWKKIPDRFQGLNISISLQPLTTWYISNSSTNPFYRGVRNSQLLPCGHLAIKYTNSRSRGCAEVSARRELTVHENDGIQVHLGPVLSVFGMNGIVLSTPRIVILPLKAG